MRFSAKASRAHLWAPVILLLPILGMFVAMYAVFAPHHVAYGVDESVVVVEADAGRWHQGTVFDRADIRDAHQVRLSSGRRTNGTAIPGYCQGHWSYPDLGAVWQATTCGADAIAIDVGGANPRTVVVSPADPAGFLAALATPGSVSEWEPAAGPEGPQFLWVLPVVMLAGVATLVLVVMRIVRPLVYEVDGGELVVPAHFSPVRVPLAGATVKAGALGWAWRVAGSALPGFYLGLFARKEGRFHAAATDRKAGLFVEGGGKRVYVSPADAAAFVAALEAAGARAV